MNQKAKQIPPATGQAPPAKAKPVLLVADVASDLLCCLDHVYDLAGEFQIKAVNLASKPPPYRRSLRIPAASLDEFIKRRTTMLSPQPTTQKPPLNNA
jgi:hypothetical protein